MHAAAAAASAKSLQSCPTVCDPTDGSPPGSPVHGIFQERVLERAAIAFSRSSSGRHENTYGDLRNFVPLFVIIKNSGTETGDSPFSWKIPTSSLLELKGTNSVFWGYWGISANSYEERDGNTRSSTSPLMNHRFPISISQIPKCPAEGLVRIMESLHLVMLTIMTATDCNNYSFLLKFGPIWHMLEAKKQQEALTIPWLPGRLDHLSIYT